MKYNNYQPEDNGLTWPSILIIATVLWLSYLTAKHTGLIQYGKQKPVTYSGIVIKGFSTK